jgi:virulence plasmid B protein
VTVSTPAGTITPSTAIGTLAGALQVAEDGSANYEIPIEVAPGRLGMQPSLALRYTSRAGVGLAGFGWSLAGLSVIDRCGSTVGADGQSRPVKNDGQDHWCLDGLRLVSTGTNEFHTDPETFAKVVMDSSDRRGR